MDPELRDLERRSREDPEAKAELVRRWLRSGLGWRGQRLPEHVVADANEEGIYRLHRGDLVLDLVEVVTPPTTTFFSRFPVTWSQYTVFCDDTGHGRPKQPAYFSPGRDMENWRLQPFHPVTDVNWHDATEFCEWAGAELPNEYEILLAAFGPPGTWPKCHGCDSGEVEWSTGRIGPNRRFKETCSLCHGTGFRRRRFPWGDAPPDPSRCVWAGHAKYGKKGTAPVIEASPDAVESSELRRWTPARKNGLSPCDVADSAGNVRVWSEDGSVLGTSFMDEVVDPGFRTSRPTPDVGIRVVVRWAPT